MLLCLSSIKQFEQYKQCMNKDDVRWFDCILTKKYIQFEVSARGAKQYVAKVEKDPCLICIEAPQSHLGLLLDRQPGPSYDNNASDDDDEYL